MPRQSLDVLVVSVFFSYVRALRQRSIEIGSPGIVLMTGLEVTEENRPRIPLSQQMFAPLISAKDAIAGTTSL